MMKIPNINELEKYSLNKKVKLPIAIYILYFNKKIVYIGQTTHLTTRIATHKKDKHFNSFSYFLMYDSKEADTIEWYLIKKYEPPFNYNEGKIFWAFDFLMTEGLKKKYNVFISRYTSSDTLYRIAANEYDDNPSCPSEEEQYEMGFKGLNLLDSVDKNGWFKHDCIERLKSLVETITICERCGSHIDSKENRFGGLCSNCLYEKYKDEIIGMRKHDS